MSSLFFFTDSATTEIYTLSLHDALPIFGRLPLAAKSRRDPEAGEPDSTVAESTRTSRRPTSDRKSTRLNSSHRTISYAVFCLKKKMNEERCGVGEDTCDFDVTDTQTLTP